MGRLTLRKLYLLLAEYYMQMRLEDIRFYKLICCHFSKENTPPAEKIFSSLQEEEAPPEDIDVRDDTTIYQQIVATLEQTSRGE